MYICLDSSSDSYTLVYIRLHSSSNSSTFVYIHLHSSTFVYTRLHSSSDSFVFLDQITIECGFTLKRVRDMTRRYSGKHKCWCLLLIKLQTWRPAKRLRHRCFPVNIAKFLKTPFLQNIFGSCFCKMMKLTFVNFFSHRLTSYTS